MKINHLAALTIAAIALSGCSEHEQKTAERSVSPLIGSWTRDGDTPKPRSSGPQFTKLTFTADGSLKASYVAAGGVLAAVGAAAPKEKVEQDTFRTSNANTLRIAEGTSQRDYQYRVSAGKLYLTEQGAGDAAVFSKTDADSS